MDQDIRHQPKIRYVFIALRYFVLSEGNVKALADLFRFFRGESGSDEQISAADVCMTGFAASEYILKTLHPFLN